MAKMLGHYASGECCCADCSPPRGRHSGRLSSRWRKRVEQREAEREIDDLVSEWHDAEPGSAAASVDLHEYLGMTREEYAQWAVRP
jgi:hypothetical protein